MNDYSKPLKLTVITDAHQYSKKLGFDTKSYKRINGKSQLLLKDSGDVIRAAFKQIEKSDDEIVLFCGDATTNGDFDSHNEFIENLAYLKAHGKRVFAITSTHDYQDDAKTYKYTSDTREEVAAAKRSELFDMYREFGPDEAISVFPDSLSYIVDLDENYRLFALNSDRDGNGRSGYTDECKKWVEENVKICKEQGKRMIAITHHPLISPSPFYLLIGKNDMMGGHDEIREWLADLGISLVFSGHSHIHNISYIFSQKGNVLYDITTSALVGYPAYMRRVEIAGNNIKITSDDITEPVNITYNGKDLKEHLSNQFFGMIRTTLNAAATDIPVFADNVSAMSISPLVIYRFGWLIKPFAKILNKLTIGRVASWTKAETGLKPEDYAEVKNNKVVDYIIQLVMYLYGGDAPFNPNTPQYKITVGLMNIIDSIFETLHIKFSNIVKGFNNVGELVIPLLYNSGICDKESDLPYNPTVEELDKLCNNKYESTVKKSKKGPGILAVLILIIIILIPLIPLIAILLGIGFVTNRIKYSKKIRGYKK